MPQTASRSSLPIPFAGDIRMDVDLLEVGDPIDLAGEGHPHRRPVVDRHHPERAVAHVLGEELGGKVLAPERFEGGMAAEAPGGGTLDRREPGNVLHLPPPDDDFAALHRLALPSFQCARRERTSAAIIRTGPAGAGGASVPAR